jgi:hypothetical protein
MPYWYGGLWLLGLHAHNDPPHTHTPAWVLVLVVSGVGKGKEKESSSSVVVKEFFNIPYYTITLL